MNAIVFEHVPVAELPAAWQAEITQAQGATVTVRIEVEHQTSACASADDPLFGMWCDREDLVGVASHMRRLRADRFRDNAPTED